VRLTTPTPRRAVRVTRLALAALVVAVAVLLGAGLGAHRGSSVAPPALPRIASGLDKLPLTARGPISRLLGGRDDEFAVHGMRASNPAQDFSASFAAGGGVSVAAGAARLSIVPVAYGHPGAMTALGSPQPRAHRNEVRYSYGSLSESFSNGPLGLEQSFEVASPPHRGSGSLAIRLRLRGGLSARMRHGALLLAGHGARLRYGDLVVTDATGRRLPASLALALGGVAIHVDARGATYPLHVDPLLQEAVLRQPGETPDGGFGASVTISGKMIAVGDPYTEESKGVVYVFEEPEAGWASTGEPVVTLKGSGGSQASFGEGFGSSVAISGTTLVVGAPSYAAVHYPQGAAYVFEAPTATDWKAASQVARLEGPPAVEIEEEGFGGRVAIAGKTIAVSAPGRGENVGANNLGAVFVFTEPAGGWTSPVSNGALLHGPNLAELKEGEECPQLGDGLAVTERESTVTVVAGAPGVYLGPPPGNNECTKQIAGQVDVFTAEVGEWTQAKEYGPTATFEAPVSEVENRFGAEVGVSEDGSIFLAGAPGESVAGVKDAGAAYVFTRPAGGWSASAAQATLTSPASVEDGEFGYGVALAANGSRLVVGQPAFFAGQNGHEIVFERPLGGWESTSVASEELTANAEEGLNLDGRTIALEGETVVTDADGVVLVFAPSALNVEISSPANGAEYALGQTVIANYKCVPPSEAQITECKGPVADRAQIDTSTEGNYSFTVTAKDSAGASFSRTSYFRVAASASTQKPGTEPVSKEGAQQTKTQAQIEAEEAAHAAQVKQELKEFAAYVAYILEHPAPLGLCFNEGGFQENGSVVPVAGWIVAHGTTAPTGVSSAGAAAASIASAGKRHKSKKPKQVTVFSTRVHVKAGKVSFEIPFTNAGRKLAKEDIAKHRSLKVKWAVAIEPAGLPKITKTFTVTLEAGSGGKHHKKRKRG
jgi:hypothetical protein